jgi:DNA-binding winged helix-turn-helix (wHTH) protein
MRTVVRNLRRKLGDKAIGAKYLATVPRIGCRMPSPPVPVEPRSAG